MTRRSLAVMLVLMLPAAGAAAQLSPITSGTVKEGRLSFDGRATAGDFTGVTTTVTGAMEGGPELAGVRGWVEAPVVTLKTGNDRRDRDLNKSMESGKYPVIRFEPRNHAGFRAGREDYVLRLQMAGLVVVHDLDSEHTILRAARQLAIALHRFHFVLLHQEFEALRMFGHDFSFALLNRRPV